MRHIPILLLCSSPLPAQVTWSNLYARSQHAMATDPARARMVVFGGAASTATLSDIWEYSSGGGWTQAFPDVIPAPRSAHATTFWSSLTGSSAAIMTFGGIAPGGRTNQTVLWSGEAVTFGPTPAALAPRDSHGMAFDPTRERVVLFGGFGTAGVPLGDTWEWEGPPPRNGWVQRTPATSPVARFGHAMSYNPESGKVVLFGGNNTFRSDTWEFDPAGGGTWTQVVTGANTPPGRKGATMTHDGSRVLLFGGENASGLLNDTWLWDDNIRGWVQQTPANRPPARRGHSMAFDSSPGVQAIVVLGGTDASGAPLNDAWQWRIPTGGGGYDWQPHFPPPSRRTRAKIVYQAASGNVLLFGGSTTAAGWQGGTTLSDTWELVADRWQLRATSGPAVRNHQAMCYVPTRQETLLYGGYSWVANSAPQTLGDTWVWNGVGWIQRQPPTSPPPLLSSELVYDSVRDRVVLFGGNQPNLNFNQTWEWNGTTWTQRFPANSPPARNTFGMAFDAARGRVVVCSGNGDNLQLLNDTWEWDGTNWTQRTPVTTPTPSQGFLRYDSSRRRCVLFTEADQQIWEWDGSNWLLRTPAIRPPVREYHAWDYDEQNLRMISFGGEGITLSRDPSNETWFYHPVRPATAIEVGAACPGSGGLPRLRPVGSARPWLADSFPLQVTGAPAGSISLLFIGASNSLWFGLPLPMLLPDFPGCSLRVSLDLGPLPFLSGPGLSLQLPNDPSLAGGHLYFQAFTLDAGVQGGLTTSNTLDLRLAGK